MRDLSYESRFLKFLHLEGNVIEEDEDTIESLFHLLVIDFDVKILLLEADVFLKKLLQELTVF